MTVERVNPPLLAPSTGFGHAVPSRRAAPAALAEMNLRMLVPTGGRTIGGYSVASPRLRGR
jgi:hypothetical protein